MRRPAGAAPRVLRFKECLSTQDLARRLAERGAPAWTVVQAERQRRGRGRLGRVWSSGRGGLYFSLILRPRFTARRLAAFSLAMGRALAKAIREASGLATRVKRPNDVLAWGAGRPPGEARKVCGVLLEAAGDARGLHWLVVGVGLNARNRLPPALSGAATIKGLGGKVPDLDALREICLAHIRRAAAEFGGMP